MRFLRLLLATSALLLAGGSAAQASTLVGPPLFGFNDNSVLMGQTSPDISLGRSKYTNANVIRYTVNWDYVETTPGQYDWHAYDALYNAALSRQIKPILVAAFAPAWARPLDNSCGAAYIAHCHNPPDAGHDADWTRFVTALVDRYPQAAAIEVWNEPNLIEMWRSGPDATRYAKLVKLAVSAVRARNSTVPVLAGALSNIQNDGSGSINFPAYLKAFLAQRVKFDALSMHDYEYGSTSPTWFDETLNNTRSQLNGAGLKATKIWVTEMGVTTSGPLAVLPDVQASRLVALLTKLGARADVPAAVVHTMVPAPVEPWTPEYGFSVLNADGTVKPAFCALSVARLAPLLAPGC